MLFSGKCISGKIPLCKNKFFEIEFLKFDKPDNIFNFSFKWSIRGDHCGPSLTIELYKLTFMAKAYDVRHWDWIKDRFFEVGEKEEDFNIFC